MSKRLVRKITAVVMIFPVAVPGRDVANPIDPRHHGDRAIPRGVRLTRPLLALIRVLIYAVSHLFPRDARERRWNGPVRGCRAIFTRPVSRSGKVHRFRKRSDFSPGFQGLDRRIGFPFARGIFVLIYRTGTVEATGAARILIAPKVLWVDLHVLEVVFLLAVGLRASHYEGDGREGDVEGLGRVEERVETGARDRRASRVHEAEDRCQFRGLHPCKDHRDGLAMGRCFAVSEQHLLKKRKKEKKKRSKIGSLDRERESLKSRNIFKEEL